MVKSYLTEHSLVLEELHYCKEHKKLKEFLINYLNNEDNKAYFLATIVFFLVFNFLLFNYLFGIAYLLCLAQKTNTLNS